MLLQWTILYRELVGQQRKKRIDAFADPLDGAEWKGFGWFVKWIEKSAEHRSEAAGGKGWPVGAASDTNNSKARGEASLPSSPTPARTLLRGPMPVGIGRQLENCCVSSDRE